MDNFNDQLQAMLLRNTSHATEQPISSVKSGEPQVVSPDSPAKEVVLYQTEDGNVNVSVIYYDESFWLTQKAMGELFGVNVPAISKHLSNIFADGELEKIQLFPFWKQLQQTGKNIIPNITIWMQLLL